ncbi:pentapeptide repeat-containing protein [Propionibacteriaceae bacterium Y1923]
MAAAEGEGLTEILRLLEDNGRTSVEAIHNHLFPLIETDSANRALARLRKAFNEAAKDQSVAVVMRVSANKRGGAAARSVWFAGPVAAPESALAPELDAARRRSLVESQRGMVATDLPVVVLITYNEHETRAVHRQFCGVARPATMVRSGITYHLLGELGGMQIVHRASEQAEGPSQISASQAYLAWTPRAIIGVGIAFGVDERKQSIGDVLVGNQVIGYELGKVRNGEILLRGPRPPSSPLLRNRFWDWHQTLPDPDAWPKVRFGALLSGNRLIDDIDYRDGLVELAKQEVIGGEMEALGVHHAAEQHAFDWIVVKAICDWGDGKKGGPSKEQDQKEAAANAAKVVFAALAGGTIWTDGGHAPRPPTPDRQRHGRPGLDDVSVLVQEVYGAHASLDKNDGPVTSGVAGTDVLDFLTDWASGSGGAPLCALLGEYGMGKTISCQRLAEALHERRDQDPTLRIPLYFDLRHLTNLADRVPPLVETVTECMVRGWPADSSYTMEDFWQWVDMGAVVIFDGLDEALVHMNASDGAAFTRGLLGLIDTAGRRKNVAVPPKVLVSCRTQYFRTLDEQRNHLAGQERGTKTPDQFTALQLLPFTEAQYTRYLSLVDPRLDTEAALALLRSTHNLEELASRPATLAMIGEFVEELEADRRAGRVVQGVTLYGKVAQRWLERDAGKHHIKPEHKLSLAEHLAAHLWRKGTPTLPAIDIEDWFHLWRESQPQFRRYQNVNADQLEEDLRVATFLSRQDDPTGSSFGFALTSVQEYFLARHLLSALQQDLPERWAMRVPSPETLDFLGQLLVEDPAQVRVLESWRHTYRPHTSELLLAYALHAHGNGHPAPKLDGIQLPGAKLDDLVFNGYQADAQLDLARANFTGAKLRRAQFGNVRLNDADFTGVQLHQAYFRDADLSGVTWSGAVTEWVSSYRCIGGASVRQVGTPPESQEGLLAWRPGALWSFDAVALSADRSRLAASSIGGVWVWDAVSGELLHTLDDGGRVGVWAVAVSADGSRLVAGGIGGVWVWDGVSGELLHTIDGGPAWVDAVAVSADGSRLVAGGDGGVWVWDGVSGELLHTIDGGPGGVDAVAVSADGRGWWRLVAGGDGGVWVWDAVSGRLLHTIDGGPGGVDAVAVSADGSRLVAGGDGGVWVWDGVSGELLHTIDGGPGGVDAVAVSADGSRLVAGGDGGVWVWDGVSGELLHTLDDGGRVGVDAVAVSADGSRLVAGGDGGVWVWDGGCRGNCCTP